MSENEQESPNNTPTAPQEVTLDGIYQVMTENFEKIHQSIAVMYQSNSVFFGILDQLLNRIPAAPQIGQELVQQYLESIQEEPETNENFLEPAPSITSLAASHHSAQTTFDAGSSSIGQRSSMSSSLANRPSINQSVICAECGKSFIRGSQSDSISKHAKETSCRPFGCQYCPKTFKKTSLRNNHEKTHEKNNDKLQTPSKRKLDGPSTSAIGESSPKRAKGPLKDMASINNIKVQAENNPDKIVKDEP